jgi:starch-binding outer membrane protein, SusD/RagB family
MTRSMTSIAIVSLGLGLGAAGCSDFLNGNDLINDPNNPSNATLQQSFVALQAGQFGFQESTVPLTVCMWMQQCTGIGGRFVEQFGEYTITDGSFSFDFGSVYSGGGLIDVRRVEAGARAINDKFYLGVGQVWEAFVMGTAADLWGDIPYSEAVSSATTPALDPQMQVYGKITDLLDSAIANISAGGAGPGPADLVYGSADSLPLQRQRWIAAAYTLKARFLMHTAELNGAPAYTAAIAAANNGISSAAGDFLTKHQNVTGEQNIWYSFSLTTFGQDVVAGKALADIMVARNDPRLPQYFGKNVLGGYGGQDVNVKVSDSTVSKLEGTRSAPDFSQPLVTYVENQLILAEAKHATADDPGALVNLNNARAVVPLPALVGITGAALLDSIMTEKYVALFQNLETYNDYRRTCIPAITPFPTSEFNNQVPGRLFYGIAEANANPNIPSPSTQLATNGFRNPNDPAACP